MKSISFYLSVLAGFLALLLLSCFIFADSASAANSSGILTNITNDFQAAASGWQATILNYAEVLFWSLGIISLVYTTGVLFLDGVDIQRFFAHFIRFIMFFGFFLFLLKNGPYIGETLIDSMLQIGSQATGTGATDASSFMDTAFDIFDKILDSLSIWSPGLSILACLMAILLLLILSIIAANLTIEYCAAWILLYAGCFFLGFGATKWTSDMALNYFKAVLGSGVRLFSMIMILGIAASIVNTAAASMSESINIKDCATLLVTAIIVLAIMNKVPSMLANMVGGGMSVANMGAGTMMAAAGGAAALGSIIGSGGLSGLAAKGSAAKDAISKAFSGASGSGGGSGSGSGSIYSGGSAARSASGAFASAVGGESRHAAPASGSGNGSSGYSGSFSGGEQGASQSSTSASSDGVSESPGSGSSGTPPASSGDAPASPGAPSSPSDSGASQSGSPPSASGGTTGAGAAASGAGAASSPGGAASVGNMAGSGIGPGSLGSAPDSSGVISGLSAPAAAPSTSAPTQNTGIGSSADIGETGGIGDTGQSLPNNAAPAEPRRKTPADYLGQAMRDLAQDIEK